MTVCSEPQSISDFRRVDVLMNIMQYRCGRCGRLIDLDMLKRYRLGCAYCTFKVMMKTRAEVARKVSAV